MLLKTELTVSLDYEKYYPLGYNSGYLRNGCYTRELETKYRIIQVKMPRGGNGKFTQQTI